MPLQTLLLCIVGIGLFSENALRNRLTRITQGPMIRATTQRGSSAAARVSFAPPTRLSYPRSIAVDGPLRNVLAALAKSQDKACTSIYLNTLERQNGKQIIHGGENHHQGLARTPRLSDGSVYYFLTQSEIDGHGQIMQFRYNGPLEHEHVLTTRPLQVAEMTQLIELPEQHPSDIAFLGDVNQLDTGYLFVTMSYDRHVVAVYFFEKGRPLVFLDQIDPGVPHSQGKPGFVTVDLIDSQYILLIGWDNGKAKVRFKKYTAKPSELFHAATKGSLKVKAFVPSDGEFDTTIDAGAAQLKLVRDSDDAWYLLAFRADPNDDPNGKDYVDYHKVTNWSALGVEDRHSVHVDFSRGDTGFCSTGTHYVEPDGRLLISSSYRWSKDEVPGHVSYVSRVDELPSR